MNLSTIRRIVLLACFALVLNSMLASQAWSQEKISSEKTARKKPPHDIAECEIDLNKPGQMSDILSNALMLGLKQDSTKVSSFLNVAAIKYSSGQELLVATAKEFGIGEKALSLSVAEYKHCNCTHEGGGEYVGGEQNGGTLSSESGISKSNGKISEFAENVLLHVVLHELGHALVREFDLPILGNEETLADAFATHLVVSELPDQALAILSARITSLMIESSEVPRKEWTVKGEHNSDARRAYQICALAIAYDSSKFASLAKLVEMDERRQRQSADYGSEIHRSWRRILKPLRMPEGQVSREARIGVDSESVFEDAISDGKMLPTIAKVIKSFDWHSQVSVQFAGGDGGAGWNRSRRTITVYDRYVQRFNQQGVKESASVQPAE